MPPEQFGGKASPASDLYSLGATLIYLATGQHPTDLPEQDGRILFEDLVSLNPSLIGWLRKMTELSRNSRFSSATEALQALKNSTLLFKESFTKQQNLESPKNKITYSFMALVSLAICLIPPLWIFVPLLWIAVIIVVPIMILTKVLQMISPEHYD